jgi:hypothetical protein
VISVGQQNDFALNGMASLDYRLAFLRNFGKAKYWQLRIPPSNALVATWGIAWVMEGQFGARSLGVPANYSE